MEHEQKMTPVILLDGRFLTDKARAHAVLKGALHFPAFYGKNLDALYDCMCDDGMRIANPLHIIVCFANAARDALGEYADGLFDAMTDAAEENEALTVSILD